MQKIESKRISFLFVLVALWLFATTFSLGISENPLRFSDLYSGLILFILSVFSLYRSHKIFFFLFFLLGLWLELAPLVFWSSSPAFFLNDTMLGALLLYFSFSFLPISQEKERGVPSGFLYNPSSWEHRRWIMLLATLCWLLSRYLACFELGYISEVFDPIFGSGTAQVLHSKISRAFPVPDAGLGSLAYLLEVIFCALGGANRWKTSPWLVLLFGVLAVPVGIVSILLIVLQPLMVGAWCFFCLLIAFFMLLIVLLSIGEVLATLRYLKGKKFWKTAFPEFF